MRKYQWWSLFGVFLVILSVPLFAQEVAKQVMDTPLEPGQTNETVVSAIWAYASAGLLQWWKESKIGGMSDNMLAWTKRAIALAAAFAGALGVHGSFDAAAGTLTVSGLLWPGIWTAVGDTIRQYAFQQFAYKTAVERREGGV
jgi:hypothetical protein